MDMVLLDWTRMGTFYCLAGAVAEGAGWKFVRPLLGKFRTAPVRNVGWPAYLMTDHSRWEIFELVQPGEAAPQPPHLEDTWVLGMRSRRQLAPVAVRRAILEADCRPEGESLFGERLSGTRTAAYLKPGRGVRSLVTFLVEVRQISFTAVRRQGAEDFDFRVTLDVPGLRHRWLPVKDHFLLRRAEEAGPDLNARLETVRRSVRTMGGSVALRLGLSRGFDPAGKDAPREPEADRCWLMADGFFSLVNPQP
jgi:hypothetical protein